MTFEKAPIHLIYLLALIRIKDIRKDLYDLLVAGVEFPDHELQTLSKNIGNTIDTRDSSNSHFRSSSTIRAYELIIEYIRLSKTNLHELYESWERNSRKADIFEAIEASLREEMPHSYPSGTEPRHHLSYYPKLIEQAGRIT